MVLEMTKENKEQIINLVVVEEELTISSAASIIKYIKDGNFLQILYSYPFSVLVRLLDLYEFRDEYETCAIIRDTVNNYNKSTGKNLQLK